MYEKIDEVFTDVLNILQARLMVRMVQRNAKRSLWKLDWCVDCERNKFIPKEKKGRMRVKQGE